MPNVDVARQIYNVLGLAVSPSPATGAMFASGVTTPPSGRNLLQYIPRVQSCSISTNIPHTDVNQYGQLSRLDSLIVSPPTVTMNVSYLLLDGFAESLFGFASSGQQSFVSGLIDGTQAEKNYFLAVAPEGVDLIGAQIPNNINVVGVGNAAVSSYTMNLAVGQIPTATVTLEGTNQQTYTGSANKPSPAIDPNTSLQVVGPVFTMPTMSGYTGSSILAALRPGDITLQLPRTGGFTDYLSGVGQIHIQSLSLNVPIGIENIDQLGSPYPIARRIRFPVNCTLSVDALAADIAEDNLADFFCSDEPVNLAFRLNVPSCSRNGNPSIVLNFNQAKFESREYSSSIGQNSTVRMTWSNQIGGITPNYKTQGIVWSGAYGQYPSF